MSFIKITEQPSLHEDLEQLSVRSLLESINEEDQKVALAVRSCIPQIERLVTGIVERMQQGGRVFYIGAGTSGRLGVLDASEIPPTFGMPDTYIIGIIAGGIGKRLRVSAQHIKNRFAEHHHHRRHQNPAHNRRIKTKNA